MNYFLTENTNGGEGCAMFDSTISIVLLVVLGILFVAMIVMPIFTRRRQKNQAEANSNILVGDKVMTIGGIIGTVIEVKSVTGGKQILIETGEEGSKSTIWLDFKGLYQNLTRPPVAVDFFGRPKAGAGAPADNTASGSTGMSFDTEEQPISHDLEMPQAVASTPVEVESSSVEVAMAEIAREEVAPTRTSTVRKKTTPTARTKTTTSVRPSSNNDVKPFEDDGGW